MNQAAAWFTTGVTGFSPVHDLHPCGMIGVGLSRKCFAPRALLEKSQGIALVLWEPEIAQMTPVGI